MARVVGAKGTINEGVVGDVPVIPNLTDGADQDPEGAWVPLGAEEDVSDEEPTEAAPKKSAKKSKKG